MDIEMFLGEYPHWEAGGLHHPLILQEMFLQVAHLGRKEVKCMVCQGQQHGLLHLGLQADVSAIQTVGPPPSREEIEDLYYQVYKLRRLSGSPCCGPEHKEELVGDVVSSLKNHLRQKEGQQPEELEEPRLADVQPSWKKTSRGRRRATSAERDLAKVREAHQRALATVATLEEKIEGLSQSITIGQLDTQTHSWSHDCQKRRF